MVGTRTGRRENGEVLFNEYRISFWGDEKLQEVDGCTTMSLELYTAMNVTELFT